jgi:hypothetical protein
VEIGRHHWALLDAPQMGSQGAALRVLKVVLADDYSVENLLTSVAAARSLDALAPDNPIASELAAMREQLDEIHAFVRRTPSSSRSRPLAAEFRILRHFIEEQAKLGVFTAAELDDLITSHTSPSFEEYVNEVVALIHSHHGQSGDDDEDQF